MSVLKAKASIVYEQLSASDKPVKVLEGGSRSSKTWSIIQYLLLNHSLCRTGIRITIVRERLTWLKATVLKDFEEITTLYNIPVYPDINLNRPDQTYKVGGAEWSFIGLDEQQKLFGRKQTIAWINEVIGDSPNTSISKQDFDQIEMRTEELMILDYNPKATVHWIYDNVVTRPDVDFIHSTMLHNPFLPDKIRRKILSYEPTEANKKAGTADETMWNIYGLGKRGDVKGLIFPNVTYVKEFPVNCRWVAYGLDFGYTNDVSALIKIGFSEGELYLDELIYEDGLTNPDLCEKMKGLGINGSSEIIADSAEPKSIAEIKRKGYKIIEAVKGAGSVKYGIDTLKSYKINITETSLNLKVEQTNYKWKLDNAGKPTNEPIDAFNHLWDAARYAASVKISKPTPRPVKIRF